MSEKRAIEDTESIETKRVKVDEQVSEQQDVAVPVINTTTKEEEVIATVTDATAPAAPAAPAKGIQEFDVGITEYVNKEISGFQGVIKQRYTDFLVNEIDLEGNVIRFDDDGLGDLKKFRKEKRQDEEDKAEEETKKETEETEKVDEAFSLNTEDLESLLKYFPQSEVDQLVELRNAKVTKFESAVKFDSKQERTVIHQLIRSVFESKIESKTSDNDTFDFLLNTKKSRKPKQNNRVSKEDTMDSNGVENYGLGPWKKNFCFNLFKQNKDTMEATNLIARMLKIPSKNVRFAGTKDRRGVTVQRCSIADAKAERLNNLNRGLRGMIKIGGFSYSDEGVKLGDLLGNEFVVVIRDVQPLSGDITGEEFQNQLTESISALGRDGFINYYGMQRFGTFSISTHSIGKEILLSQWEKACELILSDQELVIPDSKEARKVWETTRNAQAASRLMPRRCVAESVILESLARVQREREVGEDGKYQWKESDFLNSIGRIPRNLKVMYVHAYQSYVWNCVTSRRVELFGSNVVLGDLVLEEEKTPSTEDAFEEDIDRFQRAKAVTEADIAENKYSIFDIVLPMPGFDVSYPENPKIMEIYKSVMAEDGLDPLDMTRKIKDFSLSGSYRKILSKPKNFSFEITSYSKPTESLIRTDLEILNNKRQNKTDELDRIIKREEGDKKAVVLQFQLDTSCYATMMLREIMRMDTGRHGDLCDVKEEPKDS